MRLENLKLPRIEGEVKLELFWKDGVVEDARVCITSIRGIERAFNRSEGARHSASQTRVGGPSVSFS